MIPETIKYQHLEVINKNIEIYNTYLKVLGCKKMKVEKSRVQPRTFISSWNVYERRRKNDWLIICQKTLPKQIFTN